MHGRGVYRWSDGTSFEGEWEDGIAHGNGQVISNDGLTQTDGFWENNDNSIHFTSEES